MKTSLTAGIALLCTIGSTVFSQEAEPAFKPSISVNTFSVDLYRKLSSENAGNLFFSPYSISTALAMTYGGARGDTAEEMNRVLHFGGQNATHPAFAALRTSLNGIQEKGDIQLSIANALWPQQDYAFLPAYMDLIRKDYGSEIRPVNYAQDTEGARKQINRWVEQQTNQKIKDLIGQGVLNSLTRLVLVNAIYFKGNWASQFDAKDTRTAQFRLPDGNTADVQMMSRKARYGLAEEDNLQVLELPYEGGDLSMLVLLPSEADGLPALEQAISTDMLSSLGFRTQEVQVSLPVFKLESSFGMSETLKQMGMPKAFSTESDLSGMDGTRDLYISAVIHKAFIEVNEEGTEAAAATGVVVGLRSLPRPPKEFNADHPFLFLIRENSTGTILFMGRMMDPSK
jgi:serpin B